MTIFDEIIKGKIPCDKVYEDESCLAFQDINPVAPIHILIIPKTPIQNISALEEQHVELAGRLLLTAKKIAQQLKIDHYRLVTNNGAGAGQSVFHLHIHLLAGRAFAWPPC
jgi:histidine triad (HIT) family protein